nr:ribosomal RNA processing protein 1 homolog A-like [Ciona intestinalis]|eukprot:XP_002128128.1 ribosomal RNA processing protein 1 homolog A-like [Ciona intestinalis]
MTVEASSKHDVPLSSCSAVEAKFAQRLASNEKKIRDRAFKKLRQFMIARSVKQEGGFVRNEMIKMWKGLFYCMWMSDKPLIQEELANQMAQLITQLGCMKTSMLYLETFLATIQREWLGIDRLRMDKFLLLTRFMLRNAFECLKNKGWETGDIGWLTSILSNGPLCSVAPTANPTSGPSLGIRYHFIDIYLEELTACGIDSLEPEKATDLLLPFCSLVNNTSVIELKERVAEKIFQEIIDQSDAALKLVSEVSGEAPPDQPRLSFDYSGIADSLLEQTKQPGAMARNRKKVYQIIQNFREVASGNLPLDDFPNVPPDSDDLPQWKMEEKMVKEQAWEMTQELDKEYRERKKEKEENRSRKRKKKVVVDDVCEVGGTVPVETKTESADNVEKKSKNKYAKPKPEKKKKKKQQQQQQGSAENVTDLENYQADTNVSVASNEAENTQDSTMESVLVGSAFNGLSSTLEGSSGDSEMDCTVTELLPSPKKSKVPVEKEINEVSVNIENVVVSPVKRKTKKSKKNVTARQKKLDLLKEIKNIEKPQDVEVGEQKSEDVKDEINSSQGEDCGSKHFMETTKLTVKKKPVKQSKQNTKSQISEIPEPNVNVKPIQENVVDSTVSNQVEKPIGKSKNKKFATFSTTLQPTAAFFKTAASKAKPKTPQAKKRPSAIPDVHSAKRVSFEMSKVQIQPFHKNEKSSAVSPSPLSIPFDPEKTPDFGLLKSKAKRQITTRRSKAAEFF